MLEYQSLSAVAGVGVCSLGRVGRAVAGAAYQFLRRFPDGCREHGAFSRAPERSGRTPDTPGRLLAPPLIDVDRTLGQPTRPKSGRRAVKDVHLISHTYSEKPQNIAEPRIWFKVQFS